MEKKLLVGVDLGGTTTKIAFIDMYGEIVEKWEIPTDISEQGKHIIVNIAKAIDDKLEELGKKKEDLAGIGMGAPGPVDEETGNILTAVNLGWKNYPLRNHLEVETGLPAIVENDANIAAIGEMWKGAGEGSKNLVAVTLGTGVGGGVIVDGQIVSGVNGAAGEIGHIVSELNGAPCNCGKKGCLETIASATGIVRVANEMLQEGKPSILANLKAENGGISAKDVFDAVDQKDEVALAVVDKVASYLGLAIANVGNVLNPERVVIGGGVSKAGDKILIPVTNYFKQYAFSSVADSTQLAIATLGNDAGVIGGAYLVKTKLMK
ncbi:MAG: ROK family glucokinase [Bacillaceae bacterium]